ncbi:MAG: ATP-dependent zinc metalloprotease FtsH [Victivallales bacterium]|jgi:cell division protease FtsH
MNENNSKKINKDEYKKDEKKKPAVQPVKKAPQMAIFVWLLIFLSLGILFAYNHNKKDFAEWDQSSFEKELAAGNILTVNLSPENDRIYYVEGKYKAASSSKDAPQAENGEYLYRSKVVYSEKLDEMLRANSVIVRKIDNKDPWLKSLVLTILPIIILVGLLYFLFSRQIKMAGKGAMQFGKSKARMILPSDKKVTFNDVAGADEAKEETKEIIDFLKDPLKFKMVGGRIPKGALLMGPPGTGKTLLAKAIAGEAEVPFFSISGSDFVEMFVGVGASRVRDMFEQARRYAPCIIFIDEIDAVGRSRFSGIGGGHDEREQTLNALLVEMDGLETQEGVIIIAATNRPDVLDPALLRPGRFDRQVVLDLPDIKGRRQILDVHIKNIKIEPDVNLDTIARGTPGFSGADLANLINEAALLAARLDKKAAGMSELEEARDKVRWGRERKSRKISENERKITAFHEAGHALVSLSCPKSMPIHKVTIIPRGMAYLGATMHLPEEDRYTQSRTELVEELAVLMGGRAAEQIVFNDITSGAASDIEHATKIAKLMVCTFGMSSKMGTMQYGSREGNIYLGRDIGKSEGFSEETSREIDMEIKLLIDNAKKRADMILSENRVKLDILANKLLEVETLDGPEVRKLLGFEEKKAPASSVPEMKSAESKPEENKTV